MTLTVPLEAADQKIGIRIAEGVRIADQQILVEDSLDPARAEWRTWREYTEELLRHLSRSEQAAEEFVERGAGLVVGPLASPRRCAVVSLGHPGGP